MAKEKDKKGRGPEKQESRVAEVARHSAKERPRLRSRFEKEIAPALMKEIKGAAGREYVLQLPLACLPTGRDR